MNPSLQIFAASMNSSAESAQQTTLSRTAPVRLGFTLAVALLSAACSQAATPVAAEAAHGAPSPAPGTLASTNGSQSGHTSTASPADRASSIVKAVMEQQYGENFEAKLGCWTYSAELPGGSQDFCMKPGAPSFVRSDGTEYLYFYAYSRSDIDDAAYSYGHATPGLMGAFRVRVDSAAQWKLMAASKEMMFGSVGNCGCQEARFVRLGRDLYGWQFASGGVWQGIAVFNHNLVAPHDGKFVDVSAIPQVAEDEQDVEYGIVVDDSDKDAPAYPLLVTKSMADGKKEDLKVSFDQQKWQYTLPTEG